MFIVFLLFGKQYEIRFYLENNSLITKIRDIKKIVWLYRIGDPRKAMITHILV